MTWVITKAIPLTAVALALVAGTARAAESNLATIKLVSVTTKESSGKGPAVPGEPTGEAAVSSLRESSRLYNAVRQFGKPAKAQVGNDRAVMVRFASGRRWSTVTATLPGGTIHSVGYVRPVAGDALIPVVGGTKRYAHVTGWLSIRDVGATNFAANIYTLRMP
jgi:hypothetical protein